VNATRFSREVNERKLKKFIEECELTKEVYNTVKEQLKLEKEKQGEKRDGEGEGEGEREDKKNKNYNLILSLKEKEGLSEKVDRIISLKN